MGKRTLPSAIGRVLHQYGVRGAIRRFGVRGALRRAWELTGSGAVLREAHLWYELDPGGERPRRPLAEGLLLRHGEQSDLALLEQLDTVTPAQGGERLLDGNDWWVVLDGDQILFSCWIFRERTPAIAAPGGFAALPAGIVCLEDSVTAVAARGRGVAPGAWTAIADSLAEEGQRHMITKVEVENVPSRRAVEKAGFRPVALMYFRRLGPRSRTSLEVLDGQRGEFLFKSLGVATKQIGTPGRSRS